MKKVAAFFDIDGTLYRDSLMIEHFRKLVTYEIISEASWQKYPTKAYNDWDTRQGNYDDYLFQVSDIYVECLKGVSERSIYFAADQVIRLKADRVYRFTRSRIKWHLDQGHIVIFISGSPNFLVKRMAKKYKVKDYIGADYIFEDKKFTGEVTPMWDSKSKNEAIDMFVKKYKIDLSKSYSYGDTNGDLTMLKRVGNPITINPTKELLMNIQKDPYLSERVEIYVERKDIIFKLPTNVDFLKSTDLFVEK